MDKVKLKVTIEFEVTAFPDWSKLDSLDVICESTVIDFKDPEHLKNVLMDQLYDVKVEPVDGKK